MIVIVLLGVFLFIQCSLILFSKWLHNCIHGGTMCENTVTVEAYTNQTRLSCLQQTVYVLHNASHKF